MESDGVLGLSKRHIESYLFDDEVLTKLASEKGKPECIDQILAIKQEKITASVERGNPSDDLKSASGEIYVAVKTILDDTQCGSNVDAFMRDTLAPLITPGMGIYNELYKDIIDKVSDHL